MTDVDHDPATELFWRSQLAADQGQWTESLQLLHEARALDPEASVLREFESEALVRLGLTEEARVLLAGVGSESLTDQEAWRLHWLSQPARQAGGESESLVLHPLYGTRAIEKVDLLVAGPVADEVLEEVADFHAREFGGHQMTVFRLTSECPPDSFEALRAQLEVGAEPSWMSELLERAEAEKPGVRALLLTVARAEQPTAYSAGFGAPGMAVVSLMPGDPFQATVIAHELYHSLLDLNHTNGCEGPLDLRSVMGPLGLRAPLSHTYLCPQHFQACSCTPEVQAMVDAGELEDAVQACPGYLGVYPLLARRYLGEERVGDAVGALESWFACDPGPEAAAALGELLLNLGRDPAPYFFRSRGHGQVANTHLYLAQGCLNGCHFEPAVDELERARALEPENLFILGMLAWAHHGLGNFELAEALYVEALEMFPDWESARARLRWLRGERYEAPYADPDLLWVAALTRGQDAVESLRSLSEPKCLLLRGRLLAEAGEREAALRVLEECRGDDPAGLQGKVALAWIQYLKASPEASETLREALVHWPGEPSALVLEGLLGR